MDIKKLEQIRKLLELARSAGDSAEGRVAKEKAISRMESLGVTEKEVLQYKRVVLTGRTQIWQQALLEACAETFDCGLQVDRLESEWFLTGSLASTEQAQVQFLEICRQLSTEASKYLSVVRASLRKEGDRPSELRACLEKMRRIFLEAATLSVIGRILGRMLERGDQHPESPEKEEIEHGEGDVDSKKRPFEKLTDQVDDGAEFDWDLELSADLDAEDPSTAGMLAGERVFISPPWESNERIEKLLPSTG